MRGQGLAARHPRAIMLMPGGTPRETTTPATRASAWAVLLCPLVSGVLLYLAYFPVAVGWLAWVAPYSGACFPHRLGRIGNPPHDAQCRMTARTISNCAFRKRAGGSRDGWVARAPLTNGAVRELLDRARLVEIATWPDLAGIPRVSGGKR